MSSPSQDILLAGDCLGCSKLVKKAIIITKSVSRGAGDQNFMGGQESDIINRVYIKVIKLT